MMDGTISSINAILPQASLEAASNVALKPSSTNPISGADFSKILSSDTVATATDTSDKVDETSKADDLRAEKVKKEFEAVILSQFIGEMLSSTSDIYGDGMQGDLINTVLKDAISKQIANSGGLGIKNLL